MSTLFSEISNLLTNQDTDYIPDYNFHNNNKIYNDVIKTRIFNITYNYGVTIKFDSKAFINNYINILLKYNKIKINDINNVNEINEIFINTSYYYKTMMNKGQQLLELKFKTWVYTYGRNVMFVTNNFDDSFYKTFFTSTNINHNKKNIFTSLFKVDTHIVYNDVLMLCILFYNSKLTMDKFIEKYNVIKQDYKLLFIILVYVNKYCIKSINDINELFYYQRYYFSLYLMMFCIELLKELGYSNILTKISIDNNKYIRNIMKNSSSDLIKYISSNMYNKLVIYTKLVYDTLHRAYPNNTDIITDDDYIKNINELINNMTKTNVTTTNEHNTNASINEDHKIKTSYDQTQALQHDSHNTSNENINTSLTNDINFDLSYKSRIGEPIQFEEEYNKVINSINELIRNSIISIEEPKAKDIIYFKDINNCYHVLTPSDEIKNCIKELFVSRDPSNLYNVTRILIQLLIDDNKDIFCVLHTLATSHKLFNNEELNNICHDRYYTCFPLEELKMYSALLNINLIY